MQLIIPNGFKSWAEAVIFLASILLDQLTMPAVLSAHQTFALQAAVWARCLGRFGHLQAAASAADLQNRSHLI